MQRSPPYRQGSETYPVLRGGPDNRAVPHLLLDQIAASIFGKIPICERARINQGRTKHIQKGAYPVGDTKENKRTRGESGPFKPAKEFHRQLPHHERKTLPPACFNLGIRVSNVDGANLIDLRPNSAHLAKIDGKDVIVDPAQLRVVGLRSILHQCLCRGRSLGLQGDA
jgi:hypothetical protein